MEWERERGANTYRHREWDMVESKSKSKSAVKKITTLDYQFEAAVFLFNRAFCYFFCICLTDKRGYCTSHRTSFVNVFIDSLKCSIEPYVSIEIAFGCVEWIVQWIFQVKKGSFINQNVEQPPFWFCTFCCIASINQLVVFLVIMCSNNFGDIFISSKCIQRKRGCVDCNANRRQIPMPLRVRC